MSKQQLLFDIWCSNFGLGIENVFGPTAWAKFAELRPGDDIVVVGNGPVSSLRHGEDIDSAKLVMRCNRYSQYTNSAKGRRKIGRKCDVQVICLHGREFGVGVGEFLGERGDHGRDHTTAAQWRCYSVQNLFA